jgi:cell division cycle protein 20 (cofactor of APC complex)
LKSSKIGDFKFKLNLAKYEFAFPGNINHLMELENPDDYVSSVRWVAEGNILAVGNSQGDVLLWDIEKAKQVKNG